MSQRQICPRCGQPIPSQARNGVYLPARKAEIFDVIARRPDISAERLASTCAITVNAVRQHVHQINSLLAASGTRISGTGPGMKGCYRIIREKLEAAE